METYRKLVFGLVLAAFLAFLPLWVSADGSRYFVKSTKGFWKNTLGVRHEFSDGFTTEASDFQLRLAKIFGVEIQEVAVLQISPEESSDSDEEPAPAADPDENDEDTLDATPEPAKVPAPKNDRGKNSKERSLPSDQTPWGIETIYNNVDIGKTSGGAGVNVAVLDTGVDVNHPDLKNRIIQCKDFTSPRSAVIDGKCDDKNGHGTHVAGIIAADAGYDSLGIYGVAPESQIFAYKVCGPSGSCYADDIAAALIFAADSGANVVNMSLGSNSSINLIKNAVEYSASKGVLMVAATGNDGPFPDSIDYPAAYPQVVAVGALDQFFTVTDWSSRGINSETEPFVVEEKDVEFAAPGEYVESAWNNGDYAILSGTSMASPFVAGLAAKYWFASLELQPSLDSSQRSGRDEQTEAEDMLSATREFIQGLATDLLPIGDDNASGFGLPQVK